MVSGPGGAGVWSGGVSGWGGVWSRGDVIVVRYFKADF